MALTRVQRALAACATVMLCLGAATDVVAQTPGAPIVTVNPDNSVVLSYSAPIVPPSGTFLAVTYNGMPLGNIAIGQNTAIASGAPLVPGAYTVQVVWPSGRSDIVGVTIGVGPGTTPGTTTLQPAVINDGSNVFLSWDPIPGATSYEIEAFVFNTGQRLILPVGGMSSVVVPSVPAGNYAVRVRGRNAIGYGGFSNQILVNVSSPFRLRDLEVSLTWNTTADMDLHIIEPNDHRVWWKDPKGINLALDTDNTTGFGPETASIAINGAQDGIYQIVIVHYRNSAPTTSTIAITLGVGTDNPVTKVFTRNTNEASASTGYRVAFVDVINGVIGECVPTVPACTVSVPPADERPGQKSK
jgi:hypothetical protein